MKRYPFKKNTPKGGRNIFKAILGMDRANLVALNGATFNVKKGETFGLLGPNGAGKTTLIKILSTLLTFEGGRITVAGTDLKRNPNKVLENLQTVLTGSRGFEWRLTARQSLLFYAKLYGMNRAQAEERVASLFKMTGLTGYESTGFQRFSSGMGRRLLLARALLRDAPILLFDEPTANLDPNSAQNFRHLIRGLSTERGKTVMIATHNMFEAQDLCDTIAIINKGKVIAVGAPDEVRHLFGKELKVTLGVSFTNPDSEKLLVDTLKGTPGVSGLSSTVDGQNARIVLKASTTVDVNSLLRSILAEDIVVRSLETSYPSLEDVFVALTTEAEN